MTRRTKTFVATFERDKGKHFLLTELPAKQGEDWAVRFFLSLARSGVEVPDDIMQAGMAGVAVVGFRMFSAMGFADARELLTEMFTCIRAVGDPMRAEATTRALVDRGAEGDDIEEIATRWQLRQEVFGLHVDFSKLGALLKSVGAPGANTSPTTGTSPAPSGP